MEWVALALLAAAVVTVTVLVATGRFEPAPLADATSTVPPLELAERPTSADVDALRLGTAVYGYVPGDVDAALEARRDRLAEQERALGEQEQGQGQEQALAEQGGHVHPHA